MQSMVTLYCTALTTTSMTFATPEEHDLTNHFAKLNKARGSAGWFGAYESFTILKLPSLFLGAAYVPFKRVLMEARSNGSWREGTLLSTLQSHRQLKHSIVSRTPNSTRHVCF